MGLLAAVAVGACGSGVPSVTVHGRVERVDIPSVHLEPEAMELLSLRTPAQKACAARYPQEPGESLAQEGDRLAKIVNRCHASLKRSDSAPAVITSSPAG